MKTLAFIAALFLPGTYTASVFSMSMFNWQASPDSSNSPIVSRYFWIYWVVTAPLTILVLMGWVWWYKREDTTYRQSLKISTNHAKEGIFEKAAVWQIAS